jgi:hypothetical protein
MLQLQLKIAIDAQHVMAHFRQLSPTAAASPGRGDHQRRRPSAVERIEQHPRPPIAETKLASRLRERAGRIDLSQQIRPRIVERRFAAPLDPHLTAQDAAMALLWSLCHDNQASPAGRSVETMTSVDLMMATTELPFFNFSRRADDALIRETI